MYVCVCVFVCVCQFLLKQCVFGYVWLRGVLVSCESVRRVVCGVCVGCVCV
jgi:hypothetical protein